MFHTISLCFCSWIFSEVIQPAAPFAPLSSTCPPNAFWASLNPHVLPSEITDSFLWGALTALKIVRLGVGFLLLDTAWLRCTEAVQKEVVKFWTWFQPKHVLLSFWRLPYGQTVERRKETRNDSLTRLDIFDTKGSFCIIEGSGELFSKLVATLGDTFNQGQMYNTL